MSTSFNTSGEVERRASTQRGYNTQIARGYSHGEAPKPQPRRRQNQPEPPNPEIPGQYQYNNFNNYIPPRPPPIQFQEDQEFSNHNQAYQNYNEGVFGHQHNNYFSGYETPHQNQVFQNHYQPNNHSLLQENLDHSSRQFQIYQQQHPPPPVRETDIVPDTDKGTVESEEDDEEEEGEIDEEEEDVARLYDDFEDGLGTFSKDISETETHASLPDASDSAKKQDNHDDVEVDSAIEDTSQLYDDYGESMNRDGTADDSEIQNKANHDDDSDYDAMFGGEDEDDDAEINVAELEQSSPVPSQEHSQEDKIEKQDSNDKSDLCQNNSTTVKEDDDIIEMFGDSSDGEDSIDDTKQPLSTTEPTNGFAPSPQHDDDEREMFQDSSDEDEGNSATIRKEGPSTRKEYATEHDSHHSDIAKDSKQLDHESAKTDSEQENTERRTSGPMSAAEALASARRKASIPKVTQQGPSSSKQPSSLLLSKISSPPKLAPNQSRLPKPILPPTQSELPKRSYYQSVHPDKFWSTIRNWDFIRDLNEAIRNSNATARKTSDTKAQKRPLDDASNGKEASNAKIRVDNSSDLTKSLPDAFDSVSQYKALWAPLLLNEAKAQIMSDVVAAQSSPTTSWIQRTQLAFGVSAKLELARNVKELPASDMFGSNSSSTNSIGSLEPTVALQVRPIMRGAGIGSPVCTHDLLLFVRQPTTIELALRGKAFNAVDTAFEGSVGVGKLGRMGFIGHALNSRNRSIDGLIVRVSKKCWDQFSSLDEVFMIKIGSNITGKSLLIRFILAFCIII